MEKADAAASAIGGAPQGVTAPNWQRIVASDVWREELAPWLAVLLEDTHRTLEAQTDVNETLRWQGFARGVRAVASLPGEMARRNHEDTDAIRDRNPEQPEPIRERSIGHRRPRA